ncbi:MAG: undecaprenyldiphospho-muramoylpentapeptide beta-N-acetylglucosaminyltransferase [Hyphomicrobiales bacterium]|nr:MAG: undecaprenyldiphospho-muramoylpentapeptide beta-N-acetylglucosaminyltransferase [Hyphomicrobiales bacterium]
MSKRILVTAGGTGGHLFPAQALAVVLGSKGWVVHLATDERAERYGSDFPAVTTYYVRSATPSGKSPFKIMRVFWELVAGIIQCRKIVSEFQPDVVIGFGGYPTFPPIVAALLAGVPTCLHEQNAVLGRANRFLGRFVSALAVSFEDVKGADVFSHKIFLCGNPVRPRVIEAAKKRFVPAEKGGTLRLLVFGGSQGARFFSDIMPEAITRIKKGSQGRLVITQQARPEDLERVRAIYNEIGIVAEVEPFFDNLPERIAHAHLVICRSGASSIAELGVIGRPSILVPLPHSIDQDQLQNAKELESVGGAWPMLQPDLTAKILADRIQYFLDFPDGLIKAALAAKTLGRPDAAEKLSLQVERLAGQTGDIL